MVVKTSIGFIKKSKDAEYANIIQSVIDKMTGNSNFQTPPPSPALPIIQAGLDTFKTKLAASIKGGVLATIEKNDARAALNALVLPLARYVDNVSAGNLAVLVSSGFPAQKPQRTPVGLLPAPSGLTVALGVNSGTLNVSVAPMTGAGSYNWTVSAASAPTVEVVSAQSTAASMILTGLTPGVLYNVQANAVGAAGVSDWCAPMQIMAV